MEQERLMASKRNVKAFKKIVDVLAAGFEESRTSRTNVITGYASEVSLLHINIKLQNRVETSSVKLV